MSERLEPQAYLEELINLRVAITEAASRAEALDQEEKPTVLALARVGGISLDALMLHLERARGAGGRCRIPDRVAVSRPARLTLWSRATRP
jgi:hypothetical protein